MRRPIAACAALLALVPLAAAFVSPSGAGDDESGAPLVEQPAAFEIEVDLEDGPEAYRVEGFLTYRADLAPDARAPGLLLIHGSNDGKRLRKDADVSIPGERTADGEPARRFHALAQTLARAGFVVYRHHKRGYATRPEDDRMDVVRTISFEGSLGDARRALARLRATTPRIDPDRVVLLGYSEGSMIAPILAAEDAGVAGVVLMGCVVDFDRVAYYQTVTKPVADAFAAFDGNGDDAIDPAEANAKAPPGTDRPAWLLAPQQVDEDGDGAITRAEARRYHAFTAYRPFKRRSGEPDSYWHGHFRVPTNLEALPALDKPILLFQGEQDWRTPADQARRLETALREADHRDFTFRYFEGLGHGFSPPLPPPPGGRVPRETAGPVDAKVLESLAALARRKFIGRRAW